MERDIAVPAFSKTLGFFLQQIERIEGQHNIVGYIILRIEVQLSVRSSEIYYVDCYWRGFRTEIRHAMSRLSVYRTFLFHSIQSNCKSFRTDQVTMF